MLRTDGRMDGRTDLRTDGLTWVGARDTCVSKNPRQRFADRRDVESTEVTSPHCGQTSQTDQSLQLDDQYRSQ